MSVTPSKGALRPFLRRLNSPAVSVLGIYDGASGKDRPADCVPHVLCAKVGGSPVSLKFFASDGFRNTIVSQSYLWRQFHWACLTEPFLMVVGEDGSFITHIYAHDGLYYITLEPQAPDPDSMRVHSLASRPKSKLYLARLWAARMFLDGDGLRVLAKTTRGSGVTAVDTAMAEAADRDTIRARYTMRRMPVPSATHESSRAMLPGERLIFDSFGKVEAPSVLDGSHFELEGVCEVTSFGFEYHCKQESQAEWWSFLSSSDR